MRRVITFRSVVVLSPLLAPLLASLPAQAGAATCVDLSTNLSIGMRGGEVIALQTLLHTAYTSFPTPTGYFGPLTQAAVKQWQKEHGIDQVGTVGPKTRAALSCGVVVPPPTPSTNS